LLDEFRGKRLLGMSHDAMRAGTSRPQTFVVSLDGSDFACRAVPVAAALSRRFDADVVLMSAPTALSRDGGALVPAWLREVAESTDAARVEVVVAETNEPVDGLLALLATHADPVVAMATHGRGVHGSAALGGVAQQIVRAVGVPVLLVGRACASPPSWAGPVLVCHDGSTAADAALAPALTWAAALGLPLALVHVFHPLDVATAEAPTEAIQGAIDALGPGTVTHVVRNYRPADAIHELAHRLGASLVVMSTHGRTGLARIALGSVAMEVMRSCECPVLVTRPPTLDG
jgi:nucleotide-binding universal stress UspA family protein